MLVSWMKYPFLNVVFFQICFFFLRVVRQFYRGFHRIVFLLHSLSSFSYAVLESYEVVFFGPEAAACALFVFSVGFEFPVCILLSYLVLFHLLGHLRVFQQELFSLWPKRHGEIVLDQEAVPRGALHRPSGS